MDDSEKTVHISADFGALTPQIEEYCSMLEWPASAFRDLTAYFSRSDRPVLICMTGDHAPSFISGMPAKDSMSPMEEAIAKRVVPYVMWSNFGADFSDCTEFTSMTDLMPLAVQAAGLPLSSYFQTILDLHRSLPVRNLCGNMDSSGNLCTIDESSAYRAQIDAYEYLGYYALTAGPNYRKNFFLPVD